MILPVYLNSQPILRKKTTIVKPEDIETINIQQLINDMKETMYAADGIGLAAPQIGSSLRITIIDAQVASSKRKGETIVLINPMITKKSFAKNILEEGCLSVPGVYATVKRPKHITVEYLDHTGRQLILKAEGLLARVIQHEIDHLDGILFTDKIVEYTHNDPVTPSYPCVR